MKTSVGGALTTAGAALAVFAVIAMTIGLKFSTPGGLLTVVVYKGIFAAAAGLMIVGAFFGKHRNQKLRAAELDGNVAARLEPPPVFDEFDLRETEQRAVAERISRETRKGDQSRDGGEGDRV